MTVLGMDGGLLAQPDERPYVALSPGERMEVWADFGDTPVGKEVKLQSLEFSAGMDMMGRMGRHGRRDDGRHGPNGPNGRNGPDGPDERHDGWGPARRAVFPDVLTVRVDREEQDDAVLPKKLVTVPAADVSQAINADQPRPSVLAMTAPMMWTINGKIMRWTR